MSGRYLVALDQGTTGTTALVFDRRGAVRGRATAEIAQHYPRPGWVEHDAEEIWRTSLSVIAAALREAGASPGQIHALGLTNQRETVLLWRRRDGRPVAPAIVWQDRRTAPLCDALKAEGLEASWQARTGLLIDPYFSATKIHWLLGHVDGLRSAAERGELACGTIDTWLLWKLSGGACHATDYSNASRTLLYDIHAMDWDRQILSRLAIPRSLLPEVRPSAGLFFETDPAAFFGARVPVAGVAGDQQAALFGQGCREAGMAKNTYGTGSFLLLNTGAQPVASRNRLLTTVAWRLEGAPVQYALEGSIFVTGAALQWLRDGLGILTRAGESEAMAQSLQGNDDVYFVPALTGLGAPHWDPYARGTLLGLTRGTTRAHVVRAALESIAYQTCDVVRAMQGESGLALRELRADGGASANGFLMQFQADMLGVPVEVPEVIETTALGAARLAGLATDFWEGGEGERRVARRFEPRLPAAERERLHARWSQALAHARGWALADQS